MTTRKGSNLSANFLSRQNKYSIQSPHLLVKGIIYWFYVSSEIGGKTYKNQRVTNRFLPPFIFKIGGERGVSEVQINTFSQMWMQAQTAVNDVFEIKISELECFLSQ